MKLASQQRMSMQPNDWNVTPSEAVQIQKKLRHQVQIEPFTDDIKTIAGADISFDRNSPVAYATFVVLDAHSLKVVNQVFSISHLEFPYIPGLLSFREVPPLIKAWEKLTNKPDVLVLDGQGIAHPRRLGIASHLGLLLDRPSIGCGKTKLIGSFQEPANEKGSWSPLHDRGEIIGAVLRTKPNTRPVFISPGHRMDIPSALRIILSMVKGYRIPEPTRQAHIFANQVRIEQNARRIAS